MPVIDAISASASVNIAILTQAGDLLVRLPAGAYSRRIPACFDSTIGGHLRHVIEHYQSYLSGLHNGWIDYEQRRRDTRIELDPAHALATITDITTRLAQLEHEPTGLEFVSESCPGQRTATTALRELEFLVSHTVHHFALIGTIASLLGVIRPEGFGIAPSTIKHRQQLATTCAR